MTNMNISQVNKVNRQINIPTLNRHASEETDIRIEGKGESLRLPFLAPLKQIIFQNRENTAFFTERIGKASELGLPVDDFGSPVAIFNFLLPSYTLTFKAVKVLKEPVDLDDYDERIVPTESNPGFLFSYKTRGANQYRDLLLDIYMQSDICYLRLISGMDGTCVADSFLRMSLQSKN